MKYSITPGEKPGLGKKVTTLPFESPAISTEPRKSLALQTSPGCLSPIAPQYPASNSFPSSQKIVFLSVISPSPCYCLNCFLRVLWPSPSLTWICSSPGFFSSWSAVQIKACLHTASLLCSRYGSLKIGRQECSVENFPSTSILVSY